MHDRIEVHDGLHDEKAGEDAPRAFPDGADQERREHRRSPEMRRLGGLHVSEDFTQVVTASRDIHVEVQHAKRGVSEQASELVNGESAIDA